MTQHAAIFGDIQAHIESGRFIRKTSQNRHDIRDFTFAGVDLSRCRNVLDLGCAFGFFTRGLAGRLHPEAKITGVDLWEGCEQYYNKACRETGYACQFQLSEKFFRQMFPAESFDLVLCSYSLYFFPGAIPDIVEVLKPDGRLIAVTHSLPHMSELVDIIKHLRARQEGVIVQSLPLEDLFKAFSSVNGYQMLSPWFKEIETRPYENALRIDVSSLPDLTDYILFKRPLFFPVGSEGDEEFIREELASYFLELLRRQEYLIISKNDTVFICSCPVKGG